MALPCRFRSLLLAVTSALIVYSSFPKVLAEDVASAGPPFLNKIAQQNGKLWFGTAAEIPGAEQNDKAYMSILNNTRMFGQLTATNYMKFVYTEPQRGKFDYTGGQVIVDIATDHNKQVRCHNLIWSQQLPEWLTSQSWSNETLVKIMRNHINHLVNHWAGKCHSWDVVNEALNGDGTFAPSIWYNTIGPEYVALAFKFAAQAVKQTDANIGLYYNDFGIENPGSKQAATVKLIKNLQSRDIRIDGVGLQSHFIVGSTPSTQSQVAAMNSYTALGLDVAITELDVRFTNVSTQVNKTGLAKQAEDYYSTISACMNVDRCIGITVWDFDDKYSWIPPTYPGQGAADLFTADLTRKPAYTACVEALQGKQCSVCSLKT